jgi:hypothetical protein
MEFGSDHYTRNWECLVRIAQEWADVRVRFGLGSKATLEQIRPHTDAILDEQSPWPHIRQVRHALERDPTLMLHLDTCFHHRLQPGERLVYEFRAVLRAVLFRLFWAVVRNAGTWFANREPTDTHWLRIQNSRNLTQEIRRAIKDLRCAEGASSPQQPDMEGPRPDTPQTGYCSEPQSDYRGRKMAPPEDSLELLDEICRGHPEPDVKVFKDWWLSSQEFTEEEEDRIARRHGLTRDELNALIRAISRGW